MLVYNPKKWQLFKFIFSRSDTMRKLWPFMVMATVYALLVAYWEIEILKLNSNSWVKNIPTLHNMLSFVISLLLVFRTNTAYDRWWEGRKLWGQLINTSRNLAIKLNSILPQDAIIERNYFKNLISTYSSILKDHLRSEKVRLSLDELSDFTLDSEKHIPNQIASHLYKKAYELKQNGVITEHDLWLINQELTQLTDICGGCERIKNTPIPYSYSTFIKIFIVTYLLTLPFGYVFSLGYYVAPMVALIVYVLGSLELIAEEIEDPFGDDANDLPIDKMAQNIAKHIDEILQ